MTAVGRRIMIGGKTKLGGLGMKLRRGGLLPIGILLVLFVVVALGGAARSSATLTFITAQDYVSPNCVPTSGRMGLLASECR